MREQDPDIGPQDPATGGVQSGGAAARSWGVRLPIALLLLAPLASALAQTAAPAPEASPPEAPAALVEAARGRDARAAAAGVALANRLMEAAPDSAEALALRAARLADALPDAALCADARATLADAQTARGALDEAMEAYARARECASGDPGREARAHAGLGMIYDMQGRAAMARDEYDRALALRQATGDRAAVAETYGKLAALSLGQGLAPEAAGFAREALRVGGEAAPVLARVHLGNALRQSGAPRSALAPLREALEAASGGNQPHTEAAALGALARAHADLGLHADARGFARRAVDRAGAAPQPRADATRALADVLRASGDPDAFDALLVHLAARDSLAAATSDRRLNAAQAAFGMQEREREIDHLEMDAKVQALALDRTRAYGLVAVLGALLALGVALGLWRQRREQQRRLAEKDRLVAHKETLVREVHHRVKNSLQVVASLLHLESRRLESPEARGVVRDVGGRIRTLALVHEKLYEGEDLERIDAPAFFGDLADMLLAACATRPGAIQVETDIAPLALPAETAVPLALVTAELIANACEHAFPDPPEAGACPGLRSGGDGAPAPVGTIRLGLRVHRGVLLLDVADDGRGLPPGLDPETADSLGLRLVSDLARQLGGLAEHLPAAPGTHVRLEVPLSGAVRTLAPSPLPDRSHATV